MDPLKDPRDAEQPDNIERARPEWFAAFLADRGTRKPSAHTLKAYRQDFDAIATLLAGGGDLSGMVSAAIMIETMRTAFARYAQSHEAASIQRCWSTWNVLCTFLYTAELIAANPMPMVGRPKLAVCLVDLEKVGGELAHLVVVHRLRIQLRSFFFECPDVAPAQFQRGVLAVAMVSIAMVQIIV